MGDSKEALFSAHEGSTHNHHSAHSLKQRDPERAVSVL